MCAVPVQSGQGKESDGGGSSEIRSKMHTLFPVGTRVDFCRLHLIGSRQRNHKKLRCWRDGGKKCTLFGRAKNTSAGWPSSLIPSKKRKWPLRSPRNHALIFLRILGRGAPSFLFLLEAQVGEKEVAGATGSLLRNRSVFFCRSCEIQELPS